MFLCLMIAMSKPPSPGILNRVNRAVDGIEGATRMTRSATHRFEQQMASVSNSELLQLQASVPKASDSFGNLSFALAYRHVQYKANIANLFWAWKEFQRRAASGALDADTVSNQYLQADGVIATCDSLVALYECDHDPQALRLAVTLPVDGAYAEALSEDLLEVWSTDKIALLRAAGRSSAGIRNVADGLYDEGAYSSRIRSRLRQLRKLARSPDRTLAYTARAVSTQLADDLSRFP